LAIVPALDAIPPERSGTRPRRTPYAHLKAYEALRAREMTIPAPRGLNLILNS